MPQPDLLRQSGPTPTAAPSLQLSAEMIHKDALHALGENAAAVLHELRGPLQTILAHTQLLERKNAGDPALLSRHFGAIYQGVEQIGSMLEQFLRLSRLGPAEFVRLDMAGCVQELLPLLRSVAVMRRIELVAKISPSLPPCLGDAQQLKRLLFNLFANACDACEGSSGGQVCLSLDKQGGELVISMRDNGCGMSADQLEKIWQPFYTSKVTGTGLGLPSCQNIAAEHHATLAVESEPGLGSCFILRLPLKSPLKPKSQNFPE